VSTIDIPPQDIMACRSLRTLLTETSMSFFISSVS